MTLRRCFKQKQINNIAKRFGLFRLRRVAASIYLETGTSPIVGDVAKFMGMKQVKIHDQWDLYWSDVSITAERAKNMKKYQVSREKMSKIIL